MAVNLSLDQKEKAKHGEQLFPLQRYITNLSSTYPAVTAHWHKEAEFTMITDGNCTYQIQLCPYPVQCRRSYICASPGSSFHPFQYRSCNDFR